MTNCATCGGTENVPVYEDYTARIVGDKSCPDCSTGDRKKVETKDTGEGRAVSEGSKLGPGADDPPPTSDTEGCPSGLRERVANSSGESPAGSNPAPSASDPVDVEARLRENIRSALESIRARCVRPSLVSNSEVEDILITWVIRFFRQLVAESEANYMRAERDYAYRAKAEAEVKRLKGLLITGAADHLQGKKWERWRDNVIAALEGEKDD